MKKFFFGLFDRFNFKSEDKKIIKMLKNPVSLQKSIGKRNILLIDKHGTVHCGNGKVSEEVLEQLADLKEKTGGYNIYVSNDPIFKSENLKPIYDKKGRQAIDFTVTSGDTFKYEVENGILYTDITDRVANKNIQNEIPVKIYTHGEIDSNTKNLLQDNSDKYVIASDIKEADAILIGSPRPWQLSSIQKLLDDKRNEIINSEGGEEALDENIKNEAKNKTYAQLFKDSIDDVNNRNIGSHAIDTLIKSNHAFRDYQKIHIDYEQEYINEISDMIDYVGKNNINVLTVNPDSFVPVPGKNDKNLVTQTIGSGYFSRELEKRYPNAKQIIYGKPGSKIFDLVNNIFREKFGKNIDKNMTAMIGDTPQTDMKFAKNVGILGILVVDVRAHSNAFMGTLNGKIINNIKRLGRKNIKIISKFVNIKEDETNNGRSKIVEFDIGIVANINHDGQYFKKDRQK